MNYIFMMNFNNCFIYMLYTFWHICLLHVPESPEKASVVGKQSSTVFNCFIFVVGHDV